MILMLFYEVASWIIEKLLYILVGMASCDFLEKTLKKISKTLIS